MSEHRHPSQPRSYRLVSVLGVIAIAVGLAVLFVLLTRSSASKPAAHTSVSRSSSAPVGTTSITDQASHQASTAPPSSPTTAASGSPAPHQPIYYTVKPGDNLTAIAAAFKADGYVPLYGWNETIIGKDPNLIRPGQVLIVVP